MSVSTENGNQSPSTATHSLSKFSAFLRHYAQPFTTTVRGGHKTTQVHALYPSETSSSSSSPFPAKKPTISSILSTSNSDAVSTSEQAALLPCGLPSTDLLEPPIDPHLKPVDFLAALSDVYRRLETCLAENKTQVLLEQHAILRGLNDPKLLRRCLQAAREQAVDVHSEVVLSSWLRFERREEDELAGILSNVDLVTGYDSKSVFDCYRYGRKMESTNVDIFSNVVSDSGYDSKSVFEWYTCQDGEMDATNNVVVSIGENDVCFCIEEGEVYCVRERIAALSRPLEAMLYGGFIESKRERIDFSEIGISVEGMRAVDVFSRTSRLGSFPPVIVLELLSFANTFCCEEMKSCCDETLAFLVSNVENALVLIDYGLEESANLLVGSCLRVLLRELPSSLYNSKVRNIFCSPEGRERLAKVGHCSFLLYDFLTHVAVQERVTSEIMVMLLERLKECATEKWQKELALHQLGCVLLERKEYKEAQNCFEAAAETGHVYSTVGVARTQYKQGKRFSAYKLISSLMSEYKPVGWMYQELSFYNVGTKKILDMNTATELYPTLLFPYKYRAVAMAEESQIGQAILEINKVIGFKVSPDCLDLRAWFYITLGDYEAALRDIRALLTLEPDYLMFGGKMRGDHLVELLSQRVQQWGPGDCWMQLYDRWSSVDDIGSLAITHQMLVNDPRKSLLLFRQSLLLLRLNCQKAAMRCLRLACNHATSEPERLIYEGWILYDTGYREEALAKAELSISIQRSFEAFFLKAYTLADTTLDSESSLHVIQLLEEALRCPSDSLRKGQALNNLGSIYMDCGKLDLAADCYSKALDIKHTRAHQGLARVYHLKNQRKAAYDEMTKLIEKAQNRASAYEKRSEYCDREMANCDLSMATQLDPMRTYPYRFRAAVLMDDQRENEAVQELTKALAFKPDLQMLHLRAAFYESMGDFVSGLRDCEAALCLDPKHKDTLDLYNRIKGGAPNSHT